MRATVAAGVLAFVSLTLSGAAHAQVCAPVGIYYLIRDAEGRPLGEEAFERVFGGLPKRIGETSETIEAASVLRSSMALDDDGKLLPPEQQVAGKMRVPGLLFYAEGPCRIHLDEVTLTDGRRTMRLIFDLDAVWSDVGSFVIDSLPFQSGTFVLDRPSRPQVDPEDATRRRLLTGVAESHMLLVPAERWRSVNARR